MPGSFSYNAGSNTVTVTGGTSGSPADFASFVTADRAGTLNSQDARNITGVDGSPVAVTRAIRPVERLVLGGPAHTLYLVISNWNASSATIRIVGTDFDGNAQNEDIAISGNGTYYTVNRYKTVTTTQVTALSGTGFTYTLTQAGWGAIWNYGNNTYGLMAFFQIGDGSTSTWFQDSLKYIVIPPGVATANNQNFIRVMTNATFQLGVLDNATYKTTKNGCAVRVLETSYYNQIINAYSGTANLYSSQFTGASAANPSYIKEQSGGIVNVWNCQLMSFTNLTNLYSGTLYNVTVEGCDTGIKDFSSPVDKTIIGPTTSYGLQVTGGSAGTISNIINRRASVSFIRAHGLTANFNVVNADTDAWTFTFTGTCTNPVFRQYTFNLHVADINGNNISGATATLKDNGGNTVFSVITAADGTITQQTINRGYYDQAHGNTLQEYGPHTLTITKTGYQDYQDIISLDRKMDLEVAMALSVLDETLEGSLTVAEALRIMLSALAEKSSGGGTSTIKFRDHADGKDRITATVDASGNRTEVALDGS
jgi:hypothetical protein